VKRDARGESVPAAVHSSGWLVGGIVGTANVVQVDVEAVFTDGKMDAMKHVVGVLVLALSFPPALNDALVVSPDDGVAIAEAQAEKNPDEEFESDTFSPADVAAIIAPAFA
jgi:hypothetical protein